LVEEILKELAVISPVFPVVVRGIAIVLIALVAWAVVSIPAYWIARAIGSPLSRLLKLLETVRARLIVISSQLFANRKQSVLQFLEDHQHVLTFYEENNALAKKINGIHREIASISENAKKLGTNFLEVGNTLKLMEPELKNIRWPAVLPPPKPQEYVAVQVERNDALLKAITFGTFAIFLIFTNTMMLKEFFGSFIPALKFIGISLPVVFAFVFSIIEVLFGVSLVFLEKSNKRVSASQIFLISLIVLLGLIEFGFYAKFGSEFESFDPLAQFWPAGTAPLITKSWFGIFGPLVVAGMALAGHQLFGAVRVLFRDNVLQQYQRFLGERLLISTKLSAMADTAKSSTDEFSVIAGQISVSESDVEAGLSKNVENLNITQESFKEVITNSEKIRSDPFCSLPHSETLRSYYSSIFQVLSIAVAYFVIALAFGAFGSNEPIVIGRFELSGVAVSIGETILLLGAGMATAWAMYHLPSKGTVPESASRNMAIAIYVAYAVAISVLLANAITFLDRATIIDAMWFAFTSAACFWLFIVGRRLGFLIGAAWAFLQGLVVAISAAIVYLSAAIIFLIRTFLAGCFACLVILEYPFRILFRRNNDHHPFFSRNSSALLAGAFFAASSLAYPASAQMRSSDHQSSITVLVDLSSTWLNGPSRKQNEKLLRAVAKAIAIISTEVDAPIAIRYLPIGDRSLGRRPLCDVIFAPRLLISSSKNPNEISRSKKLKEYLEQPCVRYILSREESSFTDISSAFDSAARLNEGQIGSFKAVIALSDFKEERRPDQKPINLRMKGFKIIMLYRVLDEDRTDSAAMDMRVGHWRKALNKAGAKSVSLADIGVTPGQITRILGE
jgi:hypothetical protein